MFNESLRANSLYARCAVSLARTTYPPFVTMLLRDGAIDSQGWRFAPFAVMRINAYIHCTYRLLIFTKSL